MEIKKKEKEKICATPAKTALFVFIG